MLERGLFPAMQSSDVLPTGQGAAELFTSSRSWSSFKHAQHSWQQLPESFPQPCMSALLIHSLEEGNIDFFLSVCLLWANWEMRSAGIKASSHFAVQFITFKQFTTNTWQIPWPPPPQIWHFYLHPGSRRRQIFQSLLTLVEIWTSEQPEAPQMCVLPLQQGQSMAPCYKWLLKISCQAPSFSATPCSSSFIWAQSRSKLELQTYNQQMSRASRAAEGDSNPMIPKEELALWNAFLHIPTDTRNLTRTAKLITFPLFWRNTCPVRTNKGILVAANINQSPASAMQLKCCISA